MKSIDLGLAISFVTFIAITIIAFSCADDTTLADETRILLKARTWSVHSVEMDGNDKMDLFVGLKLNFQDQRYTATQGGLLWGSDNTLSWSFQNETAKSFTIGSGPVVHIEKLTKSSMKVRVFWDADAYGGGVKIPETGLYVFEFGE